MLRQTTPPSRNRQPHYSFMRPRDFACFIFLILFATWQMFTAFTLAERFFPKWMGCALMSCGLTAIYAWLRIRRRNICADSGEFLLAIMASQLVRPIWDHFLGVPDEFDWIWIALYGAICALLIYLIWRAPGITKELEDLRNAAEEEARNGPADPRFIDIDKP